MAEEYRVVLVWYLLWLFDDRVSQETDIVKRKHPGYFCVIDAWSTASLCFAVGGSFWLFCFRSLAFCGWCRIVICFLVDGGLTFLEKQLCILQLKLLLIRRDAILEAVYQLFRLVVVHELLYLLILHLPHQFDVVALFPDRRQLILEKPHAILAFDIPTVHMICFFNEMNKCLRLHESFSEFLLVFWFGVLFKIKDLVSSSLRLHWFLRWFVRIRSRAWFFTIFWIAFIEVFEIVDKIEEEIQKELLYSQSKFALLYLLLFLINRIIFI